MVFQKKYKSREFSTTTNLRSLSNPIEHTMATKHTMERNGLFPHFQVSQNDSREFRGGVASDGASLRGLSYS